MTNYITLNHVQEKEILPGFKARMVHTDELTIMHVWITKGSVLPEHHHVNEQVTNIISGELEMTVEGTTKVCKAGDVTVLPPNVRHSGVALTDCYAIDVFRPVREDYKAL